MAGRRDSGSMVRHGFADATVLKDGQHLSIEPSWARKLIGDVEGANIVVSRVFAETTFVGCDAAE